MNMHENFVPGNKITIVHDSGSSLPPEYRGDSVDGLVEVPLSVITKTNNEEEVWIDQSFSSDAERARFVSSIDSGDITTSQPNPGVYKKIFDQIIKSGTTEIAVVPMSEKLSSSIQSARIAADELKKYANIVVADCKTVSVGQLMLVTQAYMENIKGEFSNAKELVDRVEDLSKNIVVAQAFPSLKNFIRGGRIGLAKGMLAGVLGIIPIIGMDKEGQFIPIDRKERGWRNTREAIVNYVSKEIGGRAVRLSIAHFASDQVDNMRAAVEGRFTIAKDDEGKEYPIIAAEQSKVLSAHSGPGVVGIGAMVLE
jgi:DegV family protein with EDD domain